MSAQGSDGFKLGKLDPWNTHKGNSSNIEEDLDEVFVRGHAWMTYTVLKSMGLSELNAHKARSGNWQRDFSQAILPLLENKTNEIETNIRKSFPVFKFLAEKPLINIVFSVLDIIHRDEFGFPLETKEFGTYDPVEHLDNPAGEFANGVYLQVDKNSPSIDVDFIGNLTISGKESEPYFKKDERYNTIANACDCPINNYCSVPFKIDNAGKVLFIQATKDWINRQLFFSAALQPNLLNQKSPRAFAGAVHALQDYFFHSNFIEISINNYLKRIGKNILLDTHIYEFDASKDKFKDGKPFIRANRKNYLFINKS